MINQTSSLQDLVSLFEQNELDLSQIPKNIVDRYGYACLANSLMFKEPTIPKYNLKIVDCFSKHNFKTLDSLISFISKLKNDINKLFAIYTYAALNIEYDVDSYFSTENRSKSNTLEEIFETKKALCSGYSLFFIELSKRVNIDSKRIIIKDWSNFAKGYSYNALNAPTIIKSNHSSVFISIDGVPFISEPTWGSGCIDNEHKFERQFNHEYFLIPIYKTLCDHFPTDENPFNFQFSQFLQAIKIRPFDRSLKTESNPFVNIKCENGYMEQKYSCTGPVNSITTQLYVKKGQKFEQIDHEGITSYQIIQTRIPRHEDRCRFKTCVAFPEIGLYKIELYIDHVFALEYFVNNQKKCACSVPVVYNPFHEQMFVPIKPKCILSNAKNGVIIRFAVSKKKSNFIWEIIKLKNDKNFDKKNGHIIDRSFGQSLKLEIPFDDEHFENQLCVTFPSNGRYCVEIYIENDEESFTFYTDYFFEVNGEKAKKLPKTNPIYYMFKGRKIAPLKFFSNKNEVEIHPNLSCNFINNRNQVFKFKPQNKNDVFYFELRRKNQRSTIQWPKIEKVGGGFQQIKFTIPDEFGEYELHCWVNDVFCTRIPYVYDRIKFREPSEIENNLLNELRERLNVEKVIDHEIKATVNDNVVEGQINAVNNRDDVID